VTIISTLYYELWTFQYFLLWAMNFQVPFIISTFCYEVWTIMYILLWALNFSMPFTTNPEQYYVPFIMRPEFFCTFYNEQWTYQYHVSSALNFWLAFIMTTDFLSDFLWALLKATFIMSYELSSTLYNKFWIFKSL